jgi:hypothetical protein
MKKPVKRVLFTLGIGFVLIASFYAVTEAITKYTGFMVINEERINDFSNCIEEQNITLYINSQDSTKTLRKINLIEYLDHINIKNCAKNNTECIEKNIDSFPNPTWSINGKNINKDINLIELSELSRCKLPKEK